MAFRMKQWLGLVVVSMGLVALWRLPLDSAPPRPVESVLPETQHYRELQREFEATRATLDRIRRAKELPANAIATATDGLSVVVPPHPDEDAEEVVALGERVRRQAGTFRARDPEMVVGYAYDGSPGGGTGLPVTLTYRLETYVGREAETPYCLQVVVSRPESMWELIQGDVGGSGWSRYRGGLLGACAFYGKYGLAGPRIQEWLETGGVAFAVGSRSAVEVGLASTPYYGAYMSNGYPPLHRRSFLGIRMGTQSVLAERCLVGDAESCSRTLLDPDAAVGTSEEQGRLVTPSPAMFAGTLRPGPFDYEGSFILSDLEREFGADAFRRFWTSDEEVPAAFEAAFGVEPGQWLLHWLSLGPGIERASPAPGPLTTFTSLLIVSLLTGFATMRQRQRRVV